MNKESKEEAYYKKVLLSTEEIVAFLSLFSERNPEKQSVVDEIIEMFQHFDSVKKGEEYEVVLKGKELLEEVLRKNKQ